MFNAGPNKMPQVRQGGGGGMGMRQAQPMPMPNGNRMGGNMGSPSPIASQPAPISKSPGMMVGPMTPGPRMSPTPYQGGMGQGINPSQNFWNMIAQGALQGRSRLF